MEQQALKCKTVVVKIASRCNLNCKYCYMYNAGDKTYLLQPKVMKDAVVDALIARVSLHCNQHEIKDFTFVLHGGEPLLAGRTFFRNFVTKANSVLKAAGIRPHYTVQTNGLLLDEDWCVLFDDLNIAVGVSLDGDKAVNDEFRIDHKGRGSYDGVVKGLKLAQQSAALKRKPAILCVMNINSDPLEVYKHFQDLGAEAVDFLLPDCTHDHPPKKPSIDKAWSGETPYADWLLTIFEKWFAESGKQLRIRSFEFIIHALFGGSFTSDTLGDLHNEVLVIETDGGIEAVDVLKICGHGFTKAGANVLTHEFKDALSTRLAMLYHLSHTKMPDACQRCPINNICGGGYLPHRYSKLNEFGNASVYCHDLIKLISGIQNKFIEQLPSSIRDAIPLERLDYDDIRETLKLHRAELINSQA